MTFLDTHVVLWLYAEPKHIPSSVQVRLDAGDLVISPMVRLELAFLHEIGRVLDEAASVLCVLERDLDLYVHTAGWARATEAAAYLSWTRDPFDRLIVTHALVYAAPLCSRDRTIRDNYRHAFWAGDEQSPTRQNPCHVDGNSSTR